MDVVEEKVLDMTADSKFDKLWSDYLEGNLSEAGFVELDAILGSNPELLQNAVNLYGDHRLLGWILSDENHEAFVSGIMQQLRGDQDRFLADLRSQLRGVSLGATAPGPENARTPSPSHRYRVSPISRAWRASLRWFPWGALGVACVVIAALLATGPRDPHTGESTGSAPSLAAQPAEKSPGAASTIALLVNELGAEFEEGAKPDAVRFPAGTFKLTRGLVHLRFLSGADVFLPAPATFRLRDSLHMTLQQGSLRAIVSPSARGFTVDAPGVCYEDLGTEFGVSVASASDRSEVHVFEGAVDVKTPEGRILSSLEVGGSASVEGGKVVGIAAPPEPGRYPVPSSIGFQRWKQWQDRFLRDASVVRHYSFEGDAPDSLQLKDAVHGDAGRILGARWVAGRWPQKHGLLFDRTGDAVEVDVPGEFRELTVAAWIYPERFDNEISGILMSNGWSPGDTHFQVGRWGGVYLGIARPNGSLINVKPGDKPLAETTIRLGKWSHVAVTVSLDRQIGRVYVDGILAGERKIPSEKVGLTPGDCRIGDWSAPQQFPHAPNRGFRGRIDEVTVWNRALSGPEIQEHVQNGWSSLQPPPAVPSTPNRSN